MATYNQLNNSFTLEAGEVEFQLPEFVPGTANNLPAQASIYGNGLDNRIIGDNTHNWLEGGLGADTMVGGGGDDWYKVDNSADVITEIAGEGTADTVLSSVSYVLAENIEDIFLQGADNINATGNSGNNYVSGNSGNNILDGGAGNDTLSGSSGGVDQLIGGDGNDWVLYSTTPVIVNLTTGAGSGGEAQGDTYTGIENVRGSTGNDVITGDAFNNIIDGGTSDISGVPGDHDVLNGAGGNDVLLGALGNDKLYGGSGNDVIYGGAGNDVLYGSSGKDSFVFNTAPSSKANKDLVKDWDYRYDTIKLENAVFKSLKKTGTISKSFFVLGSKAKDKNDYVGYDSKTGNLWYDANGSKSGGQVTIANLGKKEKIYYKDFYII